MKIYESKDLSNDVLIWAASLLINAKRTANKIRDGRLRVAIDKAEKAIEGIQLRLSNDGDEQLVDIAVVWQKFSEGAFSANDISMDFVSKMETGDADNEQALAICKAIKRVWFMASAITSEDFEEGAEPGDVVAAFNERIEKRMNGVDWPQPKESVMREIHENTTPAAIKKVTKSAFKEDRREAKSGVKPPGGQKGGTDDHVRKALQTMCNLLDSKEAKSQRKAAELAHKAHPLLSIKWERLNNIFSDTEYQKKIGFVRVRKMQKRKR